jgi:hypothetical protein
VNAQPRTTPLTIGLSWSNSRAAFAAEQVAALTEHPGWEALLEAVNIRIGQIQLEMMMRRRPYSSAEEYADRIGQMKGLRQIEQIVAGVIEYGRTAEAAMRAEEEG